MASSPLYSPLPDAVAVTSEEPLPLPWRWRDHVEREFVCGLDLGQANDYTAFCVLEVRTLWSVDGHSTARKPRGTEYRLVHLERLPLGTSYVDQAARIAWLMGQPDLQRARLGIDATGVGRAVCDLFRDAGLEFTPVMITGGMDAERRGTTWFVPKMQLISLLQARAHDETLVASRDLELGKVLEAELQDFRLRRYTSTGQMTFNARAGKNDDLVLSVAVALWLAARGSRVAMVPVLGF